MCASCPFPSISIGHDLCVDFYFSPAFQKLCYASDVHVPGSMVLGVALFREVDGVIAVFAAITQTAWGCLWSDLYSYDCII